MATAEEIAGRYLSQAPIDLDGVSHFVVEGDLLLTERQVERYARRRARVEQGQGGIDQREGLKAMVDDDGRLIRWHPGFVLTYSVLRPTFGSEEQYRKVIDAMQQATDAWESVCGVDFEHVSAHDEALVGHDTLVADVPSPLFVVRAFNTFGRLIAAAFFPNDPPQKRQLIIDPSFFSVTLRFDPVGVLRHELGHVLGFRHEHIDSGAPPTCPDEAMDGVIDLTQYDPKSVMHYFCGNVGSTELELTAFDITGAVEVYGLPLSHYHLYPEA